MWFRRKPVLFLAVVVFALVPAGRCQENDSRRSVTEHQLMHDRSRSIQSLRRLIWLSSAMEGLHTAQARSAPLSPLKGLQLGLGPGLGAGLGPVLGAGLGPGLMAGLGPGLGAGLGPGLGAGLGPGLGAGLEVSPQSAGVNSQYKAARDNLIRDFFNPQLTPLPEREP
ncbi:unnamed protein product [Lota lota]